jgi:hypothetical protein
VKITQQQFDDIQKKRSSGGFFAKPAKPQAAPTPKQAMQALGRLKTGQMNKTEASYGDHLELLKHTGKVAWYKFECMKFRLADNTFYTPDYIVMRSTGELEAHEVKGHWEDDARVKIKIAADMYPIKFIAIKKQSKKLGGGWQIEEF